MSWILTADPIRGENHRPLWSQFCKQAKQESGIQWVTDGEGGREKGRGTDVLGQVVGSIGFSSFEVARAAVVLRLSPSPSVCRDRYRVRKPGFLPCVYHIQGVLPVRRRDFLRLPFNFESTPLIPLVKHKFSHVIALYGSPVSCSRRWCASQRSILN